jgi:hypothetical protein
VKRVLRLLRGQEKQSLVEVRRTIITSKNLIDRQMPRAWQYGAQESPWYAVLIDFWQREHKEPIRAGSYAALDRKGI